MFVVSCSFQFSRELGIHKNHGRHSSQFKSVVGRDQLNLSTVTLSSHYTQLDAFSLHLSDSIRSPVHFVPFRYKMFVCRSSLIPSGAANEIPILKTAVTALKRLYNSSNGSLLVLQMAPAVGVIAFAFCCLEPLMRHSRNLLFQRSDSSWKKSSTHYVMTFYLQPLLLWFGASLVCRALDPVALPSEASQAVKQRLLNFVRSLSTVLAITCCLSSFIQQAQKFVEPNDSNDTRNMGFQFAGKAVYSAVWVASVSLFMELLGFSTQKWLTAGGLGTVLLTLAGREIFTNFLSSVMIHATRPFVLNEWIQTKIEGYEVSGTVEHVGWWSPTIIRGDDREAVHIPNHKFTVSIVRNLSQKTHWRIKTHLAISHLDVKKINIIVADMRKVLAKNPQVEHKKLHRRVFLDNVNPENQALLILVSCFVKTSHFEEYLCVKEAVLLDLLRVISHHRARLATPIRTFQKMYSDADMENIPFSDTIVTQARTAANHPFLLIEPAYKINGDDKPKAQARPVRTTEEEVNGTATLTSESNADMKVPITSDSKADDKITSTPSDSKVDSKLTETSSDSAVDPKPSISMPDPKTNPKIVVTALSDSNSDSKVPAISTSDLKGQAPVYYNGVKENSDKQNSQVESVKMGVTSSISTPKSQVEVQDSMGLNSKDTTLLGSAFEKPQVTLSEPSNSKGEQTTLGTSPDKQESEKLPVTPPSIARPPLGENIVLNVALDDSRQMLPIEEEMAPSPNTTDTKDLAACVNGNESQSAGKDTKVGQSSAVPGAATGGDQRDQER